MRRLFVIVGLFVVALQARPALALEALDKKSLEKFDAIDAVHPDYKRKIAACYLYDQAMASFAEDQLGKPVKSFLYKDDYHETLVKLFFKFIGKDREKHLQTKPESEAWALSKRLFVSSAYENLGINTVRPVCTSALSEMAQSMTNKRSSGSNLAPRKSSSDAHNECLEARDYEGCIKVKTGDSNANNSNNCEPFKWCTTGRGKDMFGMPTIPGWRMFSDPAKQVVMYMAPGFKKVNVRGATDRYIVNEVVMRRYSSPTAGSPGSTTTIGSATTDCTGYASSISCTTTPATTISTPGTSATPGGVRQISFHYLVDCKDKTMGSHINGKLSGKWKSIEGTVDEKNAKNFCPIIKTLELSTFDTYSK